MSRASLPQAARELLDQILSGAVDLRKAGNTWKAGTTNGRRVTRTVGRQVDALARRGLIDAAGILTEAGLDAAQTDGDRPAVVRAYRLRHAPASVLRTEPLDPAPVYLASEPARVAPREGFQTHDLTSRLVPMFGGAYDHWEVAAILNVEQRHTYDRHRCGVIGPNGVARRVMDGPLVKGAWAFAYPVTASIDAEGYAELRHTHDNAAGRLVNVRIGDVLRFGDAAYVIESAPNEYVRLTPADLD